MLSFPLLLNLMRPVCAFRIGARALPVMCRQAQEASRRPRMFQDQAGALVVSLAVQSG